VDLWFGYFFHPNLAGFAGYKSDELDFTFTSDTLGVTTDSKIEVNGPVFGVYGLYPIKETRFVLFGNLSYMMLDSEIDGESTVMPLDLLLSLAEPIQFKTCRLAFQEGINIKVLNQMMGKTPLAELP